MTQQEAYKILGITEEEIEAAGAVPEGTEAAGASTETSQSFDNAFQNFNRQAVERLIKKKYRQRILSAHPDVQPEEETEYSAQLLNYAYAYLKKNGWYDGHVSKKSYQMKSRASKHRSGMHQSTCGRGANGKFIPMRRTVKARKSGILKSQQENISGRQKRIFPCSRKAFSPAHRRFWKK